jgi:hypothetical protein
MDSNFRVEGIYDKRTIERLKDLKLKDLSFDFRPRSFNFLQKHLLNDLLDEVSSSDTVYLHFENEADFVIKSILETAKEKCTKENIILEFSGDQTAEYYNSFEQGFCWTYNPESKNIDEILSSKYLKGLVIPFSIINQEHQKGTIHKFSKEIHAKIINLLNLESGKLVLSMDWDSNLFSSIVQYFDFDLISIPINNKIEVCYRNVNLSKMQDQVSYLQNLSL